MKKPNILIFNPDEMRADALHHLGNTAAVTPNLDALSKEGVSFSQAYCQNPVCTPSRCSFMSGWYPHVQGHRTMHYMMHENDPVLLKTLRKNGYFVYWGGKNDLVAGKDFSRAADLKLTVQAGKPNLHSFDDWRGEKGSDTYYSFYGGKLEKGEAPYYMDSDWAITLKTCEFIRNYHGEQPLCLYLPLEYPHCPYAVEEPYFSGIDRKKLPKRIPVPELPGKPSIEEKIREGQHLRNFPETWWDELRATYLGMCARIDDQFGHIAAALRDTGMYDDTAIFVFSDHGDYTGDYGLVEKVQNCFEDCLTRVPFLFKPPVGFDVKPGIRDGLTELVDLVPTVEELTGITPDYTHFGQSLIPALTDPSYAGKAAVCCEGGRLKNEEAAKEAVSLEGYDCPEQSLYFPRLRAQVYDDTAHTKAVMVRTKEYKYVRRLYEKDEFYDLLKDPTESVNVIDDPVYREEILKLKELLMDFYLATGDVVPHVLDER